MSRERGGRRLIALVAAGFAVLYVFIVVAGRQPGNVEWYLNTSVYHFYFLGILLLIAAVSLTSGCLGKLSLRQPLGALLCATLLLSTLVNAVETRRFLLRRARLEAPKQEFYRQLDRFVREHKDEYGFSMTIVWREVDHLTGMHMGDPGSTAKTVGLLSDFLFWPYMKEKDPKYFLVYTLADGLLVFGSSRDLMDYRRTQFDPARRQLISVE